MVRTGRCIVADLGEQGPAFSTVSGALGEADVKIDGFSAQAEEDGGEAFLLTDHAKRGREALQEAGIPARTEPFVAATLTSRPGELGRAMDRLAESGVRPDASFLTMTPWGPDVQVVFVGLETGTARKVLEELDAS